jgi:hypothetical protein
VGVLLGVVNYFGEQKMRKICRLNDSFYACTATIKKGPLAETLEGLFVIAKEAVSLFGRSEDGANGGAESPPSSPHGLNLVPPLSPWLFFFSWR